MPILMIRRIEITFRTGSTVDFHNVSRFIFENGKFIIRDRGSDYEYDIFDVHGFSIKELMKPEEPQPKLWPDNGEV